MRAMTSASASYVVLRPAGGEQPVRLQLGQLLVVQPAVAHQLAAGEPLVAGVELEQLRADAKAAAPARPAAPAILERRIGAVRSPVRAAAARQPRRPPRDAP